jgi:regulator of sigma E protease
MHGAVGIIGEMGNIGQAAPTVRAGLGNIAYMTAFIGVNLAIMNLLPIPALDGGRILFLFISWVIEKITRRKLDPKYEGYIHAAAMVLLMGFMVFMVVNDVLRIAGVGNG